MSVVPTPITITQYRTFAAHWAPCSGTDEISGHEMIPPGDDAIMIRFMFYKETMHTFAPDRAIQEYWMIPHSPTKAIMVRPSEFYNQDATSILQSPSGRMMIDFINTHFPPKDKPLLVPKLVAKLVELVQSSIGSETEGFIDVRKCETVEILHRLNDDEATRPCMQGYFEATRRGTCCICLDDYEIELDDGIRLPCLHAFHGRCIYRWMMVNPRCPVCCDTNEPEQIPWFNAPLQDGIWLSHSSVGLVDNRETSKELSVPMHSSVGFLNQSKIDGKLGTDVNSHCRALGGDCESCEYSEDSGISGALYSSKVETIVDEYNRLLASQLETQRQYYENLLMEAKSKTENSMSEAVEKAINLKIQDIQSKLEKSREEKKAVEYVHQTLIEEQQTLSAKYKETEEREAMTMRLRDEKILDLEEQIRDLTVYIGAQKTLNGMTNSDDIKGGTLLPVPSKQPSSAKNRKTKSSRRRN